MGGIAGIARREPSGVKSWTLARMAGAIRHRGPDGFGFYVGARVGLAHVRLSVIDLAGGVQPLTNEDGRVIITYNGEVYNHPELRVALEASGHHFRTRSDTEVLVHAYETWGIDMLSRLNGQFAFAIYDRRTESVFLARDRFGVRPLFYTVQNDALYFASEAKAIFASGEVSAVPDPLGLDEVFTFAAAQPPRTVFDGVSMLEPGTCALWSPAGFRISRYYDLSFAPAPAEPPDAVEALDALLRRSVALRMRADVPVALDGSGGLDARITRALRARQFDAAVPVLSLAHDDARVARALPAVIWHAESPLIRTAPVASYLLAEHAWQRGFKVVLAGEGASQLFLGAETMRELAASGSVDRDARFPALPSDPLASHLARIRAAQRARSCYAPDVMAHVATHNVVSALRQRVTPALRSLSPLDRAIYLELTTFLSPYVLAAQRDRAGFAHGVEARFPFLDHAVFEFAASLPAASKLPNGGGTHILQRWAARSLAGAPIAPAELPPRPPACTTLTSAATPEYVRDFLSERALGDAGMFSPRAARGLLRRVADATPLELAEQQAFVGILSHALWHDAFFAHPLAPAHLSLAEADVLIHESSSPLDRDARAPIAAGPFAAGGAVTADLEITAS